LILSKWFLDRIDGIFRIISNRKGPKDAKRDFGWFILILEERPRIEIRDRWRELVIGVLGVFSAAGG